MALYMVSVMKRLEQLRVHLTMLKQEQRNCHKLVVNQAGKLLFLEWDYSLSHCLDSRRKKKMNNATQL